MRLGDLLVAKLGDKTGIGTLMRFRDKRLGRSCKVRKSGCAGIRREHEWVVGDDGGIPAVWKRVGEAG